MRVVKVYVDCSFSMGISTNKVSRLQNARTVVDQLKCQFDVVPYAFNSSVCHLSDSTSPAGRSLLTRTICSALLYALGGDRANKTIIFLTDQLSPSKDHVLTLLNSLQLEDWVICIKQIGNDWDATTAMKQLRNDLRWKKWVKVFPYEDEDDGQKLIEHLIARQGQAE